MLFDKAKSDFINSYIDEKEYEHKSEYRPWIKIIICLILYVAIVVIQVSTSSNSNIKGTVSQIQVMLSIYMVRSTKKRGFVCAVIINVILSLMVAKMFFINGNMNALPGIVVPICTIVTISIIFFFDNSLNNKIKEVIKQKEELCTLYEDVINNEKEISEKNNQLMKCNKVMKENEEKLSYLVFYDALTEITNRKIIIESIDFLISLGEKQKNSFATVFIYIDNFKKINDSMGHHAGDLLLKAVTSKFKSLIHSKDMLGRLGSDEFALIIQRELKEEEILEYVESIRIALMDSFIIENTKFNISSSFGISIYPKDGKNYAELLKCADTAMYKTKEYGKNGVKFFRKEMKEDILNKIEFENRLLSSIKNERDFSCISASVYLCRKGIKGI